MARISLRDYNREIEELVDSGRTDEAIAHCRYILETYPKHVTTYRSLGKALLESQRYGDAADVFKRVLACIPDDFIAHLGMSIIREDEGDLDGSIWHMERAFEVQPSNAAVQSELRRLYGRRDGLTPAKIQLTRGAMARMSAKSHLYSQAIAELRTALADDPQRPDLQALLARMYTQTGQRLAAIETCNVLLGKFPYCVEANRLMVEILLGTERAAEVATYRQRLEELDPYESHISPAAGTTEQVQAGAITLERLDYLDIHEPIEPGGPSQPQWASSLGVSIDQAPPSEEPLPDWLSVMGESPTNGEQEVNQESLSGSEIPDWMREAGWEAASGEKIESPPDIEAFEEEQIGSGELAPAEIPDWLQGLAPEIEPSPETPITSEELEVSGEITNATILAAGLSENETGIEELPASDQQPVESEILPEAEEIDTQATEVIGETGTILTGAEEAVILGASLAAGARQSAEEEESQEAEIEEPVQPESTGEPIGEKVPDWLATTSIESEKQAESEPLPDWLVSTPEEIKSVEDETEMPDWLTAAESTASEIGGLATIAAGATELLDETPTSTEPEPETPGFPSEESLPQGVTEWLAESAPEIQPDSPIEETEEEEQVEGIPEWLAKLSPEAPTETSAAIVTDADQETNLVQADIPQWLREMEGSLSEETEETADIRSPELPPIETEDAGLETAEIPDWLKAAMAVEAVDQIVEPLPGESEPTEAPLIEGDTQPIRIHAEQVEAVFEETAEAMPAETEQIEVEQADVIEPEGISTGEAAEIGPSAEEIVMPGFENEDEAMAWLESLAVRQGALEEELLTSPEERPAETPEWIQQFTEEPRETGGISEGEKPAEGIPKIAELAAAGLVAKQVIDEETTEEPVLVAPQPAEWIPEEPVAESAEAETEVEHVEISTEEAIEGVTKPPGEAELAEVEEEELPEWLRGLEPAAVTTSPEVGAEEWAPPAEFATIESTEPIVEVPQLDINTASLAQLERIPGVGFIIAQSIVAYREVNGPFTSLDQLEEIPEITPELSDELKHNLFVEEIVKVTPPSPAIPELEQAWQNIVNGNIPTAVDQYSYFIRQEQHLEEIINEIQEAVIIYPLDPILFQTLGDAYLRANRLQEAMEAYNRAEDLLK